MCIMKTLIEQIKLLIEADKVAGWVYNDRELPIGRIKSPMEWIKLPVKHKEKLSLGYKLKLSLRQKLSYFLSFFFLLVCFVYAFFVVAQGTSNVLIKNTCGKTISPLYRSPHWEALALSLRCNLFAYLSTFLIATSFFCVEGNGAFNSITHRHTTII